MSATISNNLPTLSNEGGLSAYLEQIKKFPMLAAEEEYMLAKNWKSTGNLKSAEKLVTSHLRLVAKIAMGYKGYGLPLNEMISEGNIGLMQAVKKFDPDKGFRLATYAMWWIRASIQEYILRSWSLVKMGTTSAQKKLFFNLRKAKARIGALDEGDLHPENVKKIATDGAKIIGDNIGILNNTKIRLEYSPESFTGTELPYALEVCEDVLDVWKANELNPVIINLPATVEMSSPNIYADQIEWMSKNFSDRKRIVLSLHPHNDRGTAVAATELGLMAGADRVEGTLFGNGERTGNVDLITLGLNLFTQGINPQINFSDINSLIETAEYCNRLPIHERHPYAGKLVHTAFSGSHQDAIRKGMDAIEKSNSQKWEVPYLPIDPADIGRTYEEIIRVNSQSGKGGSAWILETEHHIRIPKQAEIELSKYVQKLADTSGLEISSNDIWEIFQTQFIKSEPFKLINFVSKASNKTSGLEIINAEIQYKQRIDNFTSEGNGPISAFVNGIRKNYNLKFTLKDFGQNTRSATSKAESAAYVELRDKNNKVNIKKNCKYSRGS